MFPERVLSGMRPTGKGIWVTITVCWKTGCACKANTHAFVFRCRLARADHTLRRPEHHWIQYARNGGWSAGGWCWPFSGYVRAITGISLNTRNYFCCLACLRRWAGWSVCRPTKSKLKSCARDLSTYGFLGYPCCKRRTFWFIERSTCLWAKTKCHIWKWRVKSPVVSIISTDVSLIWVKRHKKRWKNWAVNWPTLHRAAQPIPKEQGEEEAIEQAHALLDESKNLTLADRERLFGYLEGSRKIILVEPQAMLTENPRMPGLDGQKMSKQQHHCDSWRCRLDHQKFALCWLIRRVCAKPIRVILRNVRFGHSTKFTAMMRRAHGCRMAVKNAVNWLYRMQTAGDWSGFTWTATIARACASLLGWPDFGAQYHCRWFGKARKMAQETMRDVREAMGLSWLFRRF